MTNIDSDAGKNVKVMSFPRHCAQTLPVQEKESPEKYAARQNAA